MYEYAVAIPVYNEEKFISDTLLSFNFPDFLMKTVFILVDNNSTDSTIKIIKDFANQNPDFNIKLSKEAKKGVEFARKKSLDISLSLGAKVIIGTDADTRFNKQVLGEIALFSNSKKDVFISKASMGSKVKLHRMVYFPDFIRSANVLWGLEYDLFGPYIFGACFAMKAKIYKKIKDVYNVESSPVIYQSSGEDILLGRRAHYLGGKFVKGSAEVETSPRRYLSNIMSWLTFERGEYYRKNGDIFKADISELLKNKKTYRKKRVKNTIKRWINYAADAKIFSDSSKAGVVNSKKAYKNFLKFFKYDKSYTQVKYDSVDDLINNLTKNNFQRMCDILELYLKKM